MDDLLSEFLTETMESLDVVDVELVKFEQEPNNSAILDNIFRLVHTIKGTCGFLGLPRLEALAHAAETLMGKFRDGMAVTPEAVTLILASIDQIKIILGDLEQNEKEPEGSDSELISKLDLMSLGEQSQVTAPTAAEAPTPAGDADVIAAAPMDGDSAAINVVERETKPGEVTLDDLERAFQETEAPEGMDHTIPASFESDDKLETPEPVAAEAPPAPEAVEAQAPEAASPEAAPTAAKKESLSTQSIRVNVDTIEHLITMVSELVLTRNQLLEIERQHIESKFKVPLQRLSNVTAELQEGVMKTRMQPIGNAWQKLPRIVRDLAQELDKKIELVMNGAATELDRQVLELIKDPLTHMVRNSADHGLETTQGRIDAGKSELGTVTLSAYHEGGYIIIEIADDGRGLNTGKLRAKVLENGIISESEMDKLTEAQIHNFVFNAGLSTAEKVTSVSGRGVGMDVVRTNIELIGGSIELKSTEGVGTTFKIKIPLTLAIVSALIVESAGTRYAIPQLSVIELVRAQSDSDHRIEMIKDTPVLRLRNKLLPLIHLNKLLQVETPKPKIVAVENSVNDEAVSHEAVSDDVSNEAAAAEAQSETKVKANKEDKANKNVHENGFIVVTQVGSQNFGIVVDAVFHTEEIVVKPMSSMLRDIAMFSGNTILGDGSVIMIIDPNGIAQTVGADISEEDEDKSAQAALIPSDSERTTSMLLFRSQSGEHKAVPLALVTRLEETSVKNIETSNDRYMIQYREQLMPLVYIDPTAKPKEEGVQQFLVFADNERSMGLAVEEIVDIVDEKLNIEIASENDGVLGSAVIKGKATEVVDIAYYLPQAFADWFERKEFDQGKFAKKVLLVDDSAFFRNMLSPVLKASGYAVTSVDSAREALELRDAGVKFDVIVSDIEMPDMNGFEFAETLRNDDVWGNIPLVALSSHCSEAALERGRQAGFHDYVAKFDREGLIETLRHSHVALGEAA